MRFGIMLKKLRREKDLTQSELANLFNKKFNTSFTKSTLSQYENGRRIPDVELLEKWADFFEVSTDYLLGRSDFKNTTIPDNRFDDTEKLREIIREVLREEIKKYI